MPVVDPRAAGQQPQPVGQPSFEPVEPERREPGGGQLDRQRHAIQAPADGGDALLVVGRQRTPAGCCPPEEQLDCVTRATVVRFDGQPGHREHPFERNQQPGPAGSEHASTVDCRRVAVPARPPRRPAGARSCPARAASSRSASQLQDVVRRRAALTLAEAKRVRNRRRDHQRIGHGHQVDVPDAVGEPASHVSSDTQGQACLADPARSDGRDQAVLAQRIDQCRPFGRPPDERRQRRRQRRGRSCPRPAGPDADCVVAATAARARRSAT